MKKVILIFSAAILVSCQKADMEGNESGDMETMNTCAVVSNDAVPNVVQDAFTAKYPQNKAEKWYNKDNNGFSALFTQNGSKTVAQFDNDGTFRTEIVPVSSVTPSTSVPGNQPSPCGNHPPKGQCGGHHHKPHPFLPMMKKKQHHCDHKAEKPKDCQVVLSE